MVYKVPPHDLEAEKSVIGACLIDNETVNLVAEFLRAKHFYAQEHRLIYQEILSLYEKQSPIDILTLKDSLKKAGNLKKVGGVKYLSKLIDSVPTAAHAEHYGRIVKNYYTKRRLIELSSKIVEEAFEETGEVGKLLDRAETVIFGLSQDNMKRDFVDLREVLAESFDRLEEFVKKGNKYRGLPTGFVDLDNKLAGLQPSNLIVLAARPGIGKTSMALNIAQNVALNEKAGVGFFSLEMSKEELVDRLLVAQADIDAWRLKTGRLSDEDYKALTEAMGDLSDAPIYIDDTPGLSVLEMRTKARKLKMEKDIKLIVVDYLQLAHADRYLDNRVQEVSVISQGLKNLARELRVPVLALSQLSRAVEQRGSKKPQLSDLRESGCLTGESKLIEAKTGKKISIKDLAERKNQTPVAVISLDANYKMGAAILTKAFKSGVKTIYSLKTQTGREIKASANHPFLKIDGWSRLDKLVVGDLIAVPREINVQGINKYRDEEIIFLAHMIGDGCFVKGQPIHYTSSDRENISIVEMTAKKLFKIKPRLVKQGNWYHLYLPSPYPLARNKHHPFVKWLKNEGLILAHSYEKKLPEGFLQLPERQTILFLHHLWATDGNVSWKKITKRKPSAAIYYASTSKILIDQVQYLLLRLGIISTIRSSKKRNYRLNWQVHVQGRDNQLRFLKTIGCFGKRGGIIKSLVRALGKVSSHPNNDVVPKKVWNLIAREKDKKNLSWRQLVKAYGMSYCGSSLFKNNVGRSRLEKISKILASQKLRLLAESDIYWDKIKEIKKLGDEEVYDATIAHAHNFVANNIIVHNSIEQDSDVVMFLFREDDSEDLIDQSKRIIKLSIAKHRNGPVGEIQLMFRGDRIKFYGVKK